MRAQGKKEDPAANAARAARAYFPRGLAQPPGSFRFSADALLLAAFALRRCLPENDVREHAREMLDLGCGCGVIALACLLGDSRLKATGVDLGPDLVGAARENAARLGMGCRFAAFVMDLAVEADREKLAEGAFDLVVANMPFRAAASGRLPREASRRKALFADGTTMPAFLAAAKRALTANGNLALIHPRETGENLLRSLEEHGFAPEEELPVITGKPEGARLLIRAVHAGAATNGVLSCSPPLVLRAEKGGPYTGEALAFCPWLGANNTMAGRTALLYGTAFG